MMVCQRCGVECERRNGQQKYCKDCASEKVRDGARARRGSGRKRESDRRYRAVNLERCLEKDRKHRVKHRERLRKYDRERGRMLHAAARALQELGFELPRFDRRFRMRESLRVLKELGIKVVYPGSQEASTTEGD